MDAEIPAMPGTISTVDDTVPTVTASRIAEVSERQTLIALGFSTFVAALVFVVPPIFFPQMAQELRVSVPLLGQIMTAMLGFSVVLGLVIGPLADHSGYRRLIIIGLVSAAVCLLAFGLTPTFLLLLLASVAGAVSDSGVLGPSLAIAGTSFSGTAARRAIGWTTAAQAGSAIIGVPLLAAIGTAVGWRVAFVVSGLLAVAVVALAAMWLPRDMHRASTPLRVEAILAPYRPLLRDGTMRRLLGATMLGAVCWMGMLTYLGAFLTEALGLGPGQVGLVYMGAGAGYCLGSLVVGGPLARLPARSLVIVGFLASAGLVALAFSGGVGTAWSSAAIAATSLMWGVEGVAMASLLTARTPSGSGTTMTLNTSLFNLGAAGGGAIGGALLAFSGYEALAIGLPVFALGAALLTWRPSRSQRR
jgi:predicted MFS family arabinose efflux permease